MKKLSKKVISIIVAVALVVTTMLSSFIIAGAAQVTKPGASIDYSFDANTGTFTLTGSGEMYTFRDTKYAKNGMTPWSDIKDQIKKVVVGEGITTIGEYSFYNCVNLTEVQLPSTLKKICGSGVTGGANSSSTLASYGAFRGCTSLTKINFPEGLEEIDNVAFRDCSALKTVILPNSLKTLGIGSFVHCTALSRVDFGEGITEIPVECFYECTNLLTINWGANINTVNEWAFYGTRLNSIEIPESINKIDGRAFADCYFLKETTIYNPDCSIANLAFNNTKLTNPQDFTVKGHTGSTAEAFAKDRGYTFVSIDDCWHQFQSTVIVTPATCTKDGVTQVVCDVCGQVLSTGVDACLGHDFDEDKTRVQDDTTVDGHIRTYNYCKKCKEDIMTIEHVKGEKDPDSQTSININNYVWVEGYYTYENTATCTRAGTETYTCTVDGCGRNIDVTIGSQVIQRFYPTTETHAVQSGGHKVEKWITTQEPNCTDVGSKTGKCTVCSENVTEDIPALGHTIDEENPTKTVDLTEHNGHVYKYYACSACTAEVEKIEHAKNPNKTEENDETTYIWIEGEYTPTVVTAAGCVINGVGRNKCDLEGCDASEFVVLKAPGQHEWEVTGVIEPTCTVAGQTNYKCSVCGMTKQGERVEALGHDFYSTNKVSPTCTREGSETFACDRCSASKTDTLPKLGHKVDKDTLVVTSAATCEKAGKQSYTCGRCKVEIVDEEVPALGHDFVNVEVEIEGKVGHVMSTPTCQRAGCNTTEPSEVVHKEWIQEFTEHTTITEGTCITGEIYTEKCTLCNTRRTDQQGKPLGHEYRFVRVYTERSSDDGEEGGSLSDIIGNLGNRNEGLADSGSNIGDIIGNIGNGDSGIGGAIGDAADKYKVLPYSVVYLCRHCASPASLTGVELWNMWDRYYYNTAPEGRLTQNNSSYMDVTGDGFINAKDYAQIYNLNLQHQAYMQAHPEEQSGQNLNNLVAESVDYQTSNANVFRFFTSQI